MVFMRGSAEQARGIDDILTLHDQVTHEATDWVICCFPLVLEFVNRLRAMISCNQAHCVLWQAPTLRHSSLVTHYSVVSQVRTTS
jgi:hypothetical protein